MARLPLTVISDFTCISYPTTVLSFTSILYITSAYVFPLCRVRQLCDPCSREWPRLPSSQQTDFPSVLATSSQVSPESKRALSGTRPAGTDRSSSQEGG